MLRSAKLRKRAADFIGNLISGTIYVGCGIYIIYVIVVFIGSAIYLFVKSDAYLWVVALLVGVEEIFSGVFSNNITRTVIGIMLFVLVIGVVILIFQVREAVQLVEIERRLKELEQKIENK